MKKSIRLKNRLPGPAVGLVGNTFGTSFGIGISLLGVIALGILLWNHSNKEIN